MDEIFEQPRPRVTASMLSSHIGSLVTLMGQVKPDSISSNSLKIYTQSNAGGEVDIKFNTPLNELLEGTIEFTGTVEDHKSVQCMSYKLLSQTSGQFDFEAYNAAVEMIHNYPSLN